MTAARDIIFPTAKSKEIKWSKGDASDCLTLKNTDGSELSVNAGTSFIAFPDINLSSKTVIEPAPAASEESAAESVND